MTTAQKQLNSEAFRKLLSELSQVNLGPFTTGLHDLVEKMEIMNQLLADLPTLTKEEDLAEARKRIGHCQQECQEAMNRFLAQFGTSMEETAEYFNNPMNFSQRDWENLQGIKLRVEDTIISKEPTPSALTKNLKKRSK
jgi:hypothetical protein